MSSQPKTNRVVCMYIDLSFPGGSVIKNPPANAGSVGKIPWRRKWQPTPVFLTGKSHGQRSLVSYSSWGLKKVGHDLVTKQQHKYKGKDSGPEVEIWVPVPTSL